MPFQNSLVLCNAYAIFLYKEEKATLFPFPAVVLATSLTCVLFYLDDFTFTNLTASTWLAPLFSLQYLGLKDMDLPMNLYKVLNMLLSLLHLYLPYCNFAKVSSFPLTNLTCLQLLSLASNFFNYHSSNTTSIKVLDISGNDLNSVPSWLVNLHNLVKLDLSSNRITVLDPLRNLTSIKEGCGFAGELPSTLQNMTSIRSLDFSQNSLSSIVPFGKLENLVELNLEGELKSLVRVDLFLNNFTVTIIEEGFLSSILRNLCHLKYLDLSDSNCQRLAFNDKGTLSSCNGYALWHLQLNVNKFGDLLPSWLGQFKILIEVDLSYNSFSGPIPFSMENLTKLKKLSLAINFLNGSIPLSFTKFWYYSSKPESIQKFEFASSFFKLLVMSPVYLDLSRNQIIGSIPKSLQPKTPNLRSLLLNDNFMNGLLPSSWGNLKFLSRFDISNNKLSGKIPSTI
ncbi:hypothetical protein Ahy_A07g033650 [Arachis hypogaea]|uniref:LRR receptor-like serine/threonine-protein kinase n=1 Tax=Arachis hypogaea TaxID=3818 RepID=A0A445CA30_ARAHY|nr:hypothetical protein Ahy_A07g033650 [Arachis hypogaea]